MHVGWSLQRDPEGSGVGVAVGPGVVVGVAVGETSGVGVA